MAENNNPEDQAAPAGQQQYQVAVDERDLRVSYINGYRINMAMEEVVVDLGFNMPNPNQQGGAGGQAAQPQLLFKINDRVIMSYGTAKRLAGSLVQLIKRYEQQFGELGAQQPRR